MEFNFINKFSQKVIPSFLSLLKNEEWVQNNYVISDVTGYTMTSYGVIILTRLPIHKITLYEMDTLMGRKFLLFEFLINSEKVISNFSDFYILI